jgi:hypothetical protein
VNTPTIVPQIGGPLSPEQRHELELANQRARKIRRAAGVAAFNGWAIGIVAAMSALSALFSFSGFLVTAGLTFIAYNEFQGRKRLLRFDTSAPAMLGWNQIGLMAMIVAYCLWMILENFIGPGPFAGEMASNPELAEAIGSSSQFDDLYKLFSVVIYGTVMLVSVIFQGLNALYYFTRRKHVEAYLHETPEWVLDLQHILSAG